jgi:signal transduction histidine kinase
VLALWFAYLSARRATQPLRDILRDYQAQPLSCAQGNGVAPDLANNELHQLATQLADINRAYRAALAREQAFTRDISHELRTPLTVLQNQLALQAQAAPFGSKYERPSAASSLGSDTGEPVGNLAWARMQAAVAEAVHLLDMLLALARQEPLPTQSIALLALVEQAMVDAAEYAPSLCIELVCAENAGAVKVNAHARPVLLLFKNLMQNAHLHGSDQRLCIALTDTGIRFSNACTAATAATAAGRGSGMQQGLSLSARLAQALGWQWHHEDTDNEFAVRIDIR